MKRAILMIILLLLLKSVFASHVPSPTGYVNDFANVLSADEKVQIERLLDEIEKNTTVEISVVTVQTLDGDSIEDFALRLFEEWGIGKKEKDNGLLLLIAIQERKYRFEVGYGLEGTIPDSVAGRIGRDALVPYFKEGKYGEGIYQAILKVKGLVENNPEVVDEYHQKDEPFIWLIPVYFFLFPILLGVSQTQKKNKKKWQYFLFGEGIFLLSAILLGTILFVFVLFMAIFYLIAFVAIVYGKSGGGGYGGGFSGGGFSGGSSGGFGGFSGGSSGGGGSSGSW